MKTAIELQYDKNRREWRAQYIDGSHISGTYGAPGRALESLLDIVRNAAEEDHARSVIESGASSGCYVGDEILEAHADHPAAASLDWFEGAEI